ncbi:MAG: tetratricopeptide repeat protein [Verrucomicrobia bacterium]|nr:tetratricopeptide repeat protein [Verrucomicrobiota bacterium]
MGTGLKLLSINNTTNTKTQIVETDIEKFEKQINKNKTENISKFLLKVQETNHRLRFEQPALYPRLLKLIPKANLQPAQQDALLQFFRAKDGLPEDLFEKDIVLHGKDGCSISCSKKLLEMFFTYFSETFSPGLKEAQSMPVPLGEEALRCFGHYLLTKKFSTNDSQALLELLQFADKIDAANLDKKDFLKLTIERALQNKIISTSFYNDSFLSHCKDAITLKVTIENNVDLDFLVRCAEYSRTMNDDPFFQTIAKSIFSYLSKSENKLSFKAELVRDLEEKLFKPFNCRSLHLNHEKFVPHYFDSKNIRCAKLSNGNYALNLNDFTKTFHDKKDLEILKFIAAAVDKINLTNNDFSELYLIPKQYRSAVRWIGGDISPQDAEELLRLFPNCTSIALNRDDLDKAIKDNPNNAFLLTMLGEMQQKEGNLVAAEIMVRKAIAIDPKSAIAHYTLGVLLAESKRFVEAQELFSKAIELKPTFAAALRGLGYVAHKQAEAMNPKYTMSSVSLKDTPPSEVETATQKMRYHYNGLFNIDINNDLYGD